MVQKEKVLITGLNGLAGWSIFSQARDLYQVYGTYRRAKSIFQGPDCYYVDLDDALATTEFVRQLKPDYIIHARGICDLDVCQTAPQMATHVNVSGAQKMLDAANALPNLKKFVYISTDHVFSGNRGHYTELDTPNPKHVFGRTKLKAEAIVMTSGLPYLIIRPGLLMGSSAQGNVGPRDFLLARLKASKPTTYFTDEYRTPLSTKVFGLKVLKLMTSSEGIFHLAGQKVVSRFDLARQTAHDHQLSTTHIYSKLRCEDMWASIRPEHLTLKSVKYCAYPELVS